MSTWDDVIGRIERGNVTVVPHVLSHGVAKGAESPLASHRTRCAVCTRFAAIDETGRCFACRPVGHCGWCERALPYLTPGSTGICDDCAAQFPHFDDQAGPRLEVELAAKAEYKARCERAGVTP